LDGSADLADLVEVTLRSQDAIALTDPSDRSALRTCPTAYDLATADAIAVSAVVWRTRFTLFAFEEE